MKKKTKETPAPVTVAPSAPVKVKGKVAKPKKCVGRIVKK